MCNFQPKNSTWAQNTGKTQAILEKTQVILEKTQANLEKNSRFWAKNYLQRRLDASVCLHFVSKKKPGLHHYMGKLSRLFFCAHISISTLSRFSEKLGFCSFGTGFLEIWNWVLPNLADFLKNFMGELGFWPFWNWVFGWELGFSKIWWSGFFKIPNWVFGFLH